jgi:putative hydrolase of the HAD superfamily
MPRSVEHRSAPPSVLLFDLSEVLISGLVGVERVVAPLIGKPEAQALRELCGDPLRRLCRGAISEDDYLAAIHAEHGWSLPADDVKAAIRANLRRVIPGMPELIGALHDRVGLVLVSDHAREWIGHIETVHPFLSLFPVRIYSFDMGLLKDEPGAFDRVLRQIGRAADACVFVDDTPRNVAAATEVGLRAVRFEGRDLLVESLRGLGLRF